ncbi:SDR family oxidoreductase [Thalassotalea psychrophila]|uniref:SDR family oxidoreductase n=1 Tax=Thalassotalea psychrophila TaxID=3065647 RepID=A0ABY9TZF7_9GAMM|nr:SDR family oxidoreductase [Colwelliaceae bacterium SQ149]
MSVFKNKVAVITGAGSGIGRAFAIALAQEGCSLALADLNMQGLEETSALLPTSAKTSLHQLDVSDLDDYKCFVEDVVRTHGQVDIVINNAGIVRLHTFEESQYSDFDISLKVNLWGVMYGCKEFLPHLKKKQDTWIVNISSGAGLVGIPNYTSYNASKFAVRGFTESLRAELADTNISVSCVHPGGVNTNIQNSGVHAAGAKQSAKKLQSAIGQMSAEQAVKVILSGMKKKKKRILVGRDIKTLDIIARLFPSAYDRIVSKFV